MRDVEAFGVYLHWPFCLSKCPYCDFNSHVRHTAIDETRYVRAFAREIAATAERVGARTVTTIFMGGGTPSLMQPATVGALLDADRPALVGRAGRRSHARGQSDQCRGDAFCRIPHGRRQSRLARRASARRCVAEGTWPAAHRAGSARRGRDRPQGLRALLVRSDLRAARPDDRGVAHRAQSRRSTKRPNISRSISSPSSPRRRSRHCMRAASLSFPTTTTRARCTT